MYTSRCVFGLVLLYHETYSRVTSYRPMEPLASKIRPTTLDEFIGQNHLVGPQKPLRVAIKQKHLFSFILWGPPGVGKTTLAKIYAKALDAELYELSQDYLLPHAESGVLTLIGATTENPSFEVIAPLLSRCRSRYGTRPQN